MSRVFTIGGDAVKTFDRLGKRGADKRKLYEFVARFFSKSSKLAAGHVVKTQLSGTLGPSPSGIANKQLKQRRTGQLARSIEGRGFTFSGLPAFQVGILRGPSVTYAGVQEFGTKKYNPKSPFGTIRPKNSKYLSIPVSDRVLTPAGVDRYGSPRRFPEKLVPLMFNRPRGKNSNVAGRLVLEQQLRDERAEAATAGRPIDYSRLETVYLLLTETEIKPGFFLTDGVQSYIPTMVRELAAAMTKEFAGVS